MGVGVYVCVCVCIHACVHVFLRVCVCVSIILVIIFFYSEPVECNEPILVVSHKLGVCRVDPMGKECSTQFTRLSFNGKSSVIQCT